MTWLKNHPVAVGLAGIAGLAVLYLAIAVFGVHTLFIDDEVSEAGPVFASGAAPSGIESDAISEELADEMTDEMADEPIMVEVEEAMPEMATESADADADAGEQASADEQAPVAVIETIFSGDFIDRSHPTSGRADVLNDGSTQRFLRFEDFETDNGPDLNVYLSTAPPGADPSEFDDNFVDLGDLKGNIGTQNYEIPVDVDLNEFSTVVIWCVRFGVAFGAAEINPAG